MGKLPAKLSFEVAVNANNIPEANECLFFCTLAIIVSLENATIWFKTFY